MMASLKKTNNFMMDSDRTQPKTNWYKYERFNFSLSPSSAQFEQLRYYFNFMKESYLTINNIDDSEK